MRKVVYTAITGHYDSLKRPAAIESDIDYIVYTDDPDMRLPEPWQRRTITVSHRNPRITARLYKILPHRYFRDYTHSLWIDGSYEVTAPLSGLMDELAASNFAAQAHPVR